MADIGYRNLTAHSVTLYMTGLSTELYYDVTITIGSYSASSSSGVGYSTSSPVTFTGLNAGSLYWVGGTATSTAGTVEASMTLQMPDEPSPPVTPSFSYGSYQVSGLSVSVSVSCSNSSGVATNARILYQSGSTWINGDEHGQDSSTSWSDTLSITVPEPGTYTFAIRTWYSGQGTGSIVNQQTITIDTSESNTWIYKNGWKRAQPWIYVDGSWHKATPYVYVNGSWHKV